MTRRKIRALALGKYGVALRGSEIDMLRFFYLLRG